MKTISLYSLLGLWALGKRKFLKSHGYNSRNEIVDSLFCLSLAKMLMTFQNVPVFCHSLYVVSTMNRFRLCKFTYRLRDSGERHWSLKSEWIHDSFMTSLLLCTTPISFWNKNVYLWSSRSWIQRTAWEWLTISSTDSITYTGRVTGHRPYLSLDICSIISAVIVASMTTMTLLKVVMNFCRWSFGTIATSYAATLAKFIRIWTLNRLNS